MIKRQIRGVMQLVLFILLSWGLLSVLLAQLPEWWGEAQVRLGEVTQETIEVSPEESTLGQVLVVRVIDGDTVELEGGARLRYIGIDAPERYARSAQPAECFSDEALWENKRLVEGKVVTLEMDQSNTDRYGRLLRYVWVDDVMINETLVANGFAVARDYPPDSRFAERLSAAQIEAEQNNMGLWEVCPE